jgi:hypothetical protein
LLLAVRWAVDEGVEFVRARSGFTPPVGGGGAPGARPFGPFTRASKDEVSRGRGFLVYGVGHGLGAFVVEVHAVAAVQGGVGASGFSTARATSKTASKVSVVRIQSFTWRRAARPSGVLIPG